MDKARILIVDDRPSNLKALRVRLTHEGYDILEATNGPDALDRVEREHPDLVLLDVMMPKMDGFEVCRRIKARAHNIRCLDISEVESLAWLRAEGVETSRLDVSRVAVELRLTDEGYLRGDSKVHFDIQGIKVGLERTCRRTARDGLK